MAQEDKIEQKKLLTEIMEADEKDGIYGLHKTQTAVEFLITELGIDKLIKKEKLSIAAEIIDQARQIEKERGVIAYNIGYQDAQCNHINDAENYIYESNTRI